MQKQPFAQRNAFVKILFTLSLLLISINVAGAWLGLFHHPSFGLDKLLHLFAGYICGIFGVMLFFRFSKKYLLERSVYNSRIIGFAFLSAFVIGVGWEIFEHIIPSLQDRTDIDAWDTAGDILFDLIGSIIAGSYYQKKYL